MPSPDLSDYVTVAQRIAQFRERHPDGSLRPLNPDKPYEVLQIGDFTMLVVVAAAYRSPEDALPGVGMAAEPFPGRTPYTRGSELMNAETSAWGRAIVAALRADTSLAIASQEEVRNRREDDAGREAAGLMTQQQQKEHAALARQPRGRKADRSNDPADDMWADQPAGKLPPIDVEDLPGSSNNRQHQRLGILYRAAGIDDRDARLADMTNRLGRSVSSAADLSYVEAEQAIAELEKLAKERGQ